MQGVALFYSVIFRALRISLSRQTVFHVKTVRAMGFVGTDAKVPRFFQSLSAASRFPMLSVVNEFWKS